MRQAALECRPSYSSLTDYCTLAVAVATPRCRLSSFQPTVTFALVVAVGESHATSPSRFCLAPIRFDAKIEETSEEFHVHVPVVVPLDTSTLRLSTTMATPLRSIRLKCNDVR